MKRRKVIRYSESFKQQVLSEIENGEGTIQDVKRKYGIKGGDTVQKWARKYGSFGILPKQIRVEDPKEKDRVKALKEENRKLKEALADAVLDCKIAESTLEVICKQRGWDVDEIKKKAGSKSPLKQSKKKKK